MAIHELSLHAFHSRLGASFTGVGGFEFVDNYSQPEEECQALDTASGLLDLGARTRICLTGADRSRFLHGQVTNDINRLQPGHGCYAALTDARGKMQADLNIHCLPDELLLDAEPGLTKTIVKRLEKFIVADDVQAVDVASLYGLLSVQGPESTACVIASGISSHVPGDRLQSVRAEHTGLGEIYIVNHPRLNRPGFDFFAPVEALPDLAEMLLQSIGNKVLPCGFAAFETLRIEEGIPRFGPDMDNSSFPQECGIEPRAVSYSKGCYVGQEVLNRIHTLGRVTRTLRRFLLGTPVAPGAKLFLDGKEVGRLTSTAISPRIQQPVALGYLRREADQPDAEFSVHAPGGERITHATLRP